MSTHNFLKRIFGFFKKYFYGDAGFRWWLLSISSTIVFLILFTLGIPKCLLYGCLLITTLGISGISFVVWIGKMVYRSKFVQASLAMGAGPLFFLLFLNMVFGLYLITTAPIVVKYEAQKDKYNKMASSADEKFRKIADEEGMHVLMIGTLVKEADKADPLRLKRAQTEKRIFGGSKDGRIKWVKWLSDYPNLANAQKEEDEAREMYTRVRITLQDINSLRDPIKWFMGFSLLWMCLKLIFFWRKKRISI